MQKSLGVKKGEPLLGQGYEVQQPKALCIVLQGDT